jgi:AcrR family transcriptional regulator
MSRKAHAVDRRVARTRDRLHVALVELMGEKGFDAITVQDLLDRADVGRTTFYAHYPSKEQLLEESFAHLAAWLREQASLATAARPLAFSLPMFEHAGEHRKLYRAHVGRRAGVFVQRKIRAIIAAVVREELSGRSRALAVPLDPLIEHLVASFVAILVWWLDHRTGLDAREVDTLYRRLALPALIAAERQA